MFERIVIEYNSKLDNNYKEGTFCQLSEIKQNVKIKFINFMSHN